MKKHYILSICLFFLFHVTLSHLHAQMKIKWNAKIAKPNSSVGIDFNVNNDIYIYGNSLKKNDVNSIYDYYVTRVDEKGNSDVIMELKDITLEFKFEKGIDGFVTKERKYHKTVGKKKSAFVKKENATYNDNFISINYTFYDRNGKVLNNLPLKEQNQNIVLVDKYIIDNHYYFVVSMGHGLAHGSTKKPKIIIVKVDKNGNEIDRIDTEIPYDNAQGDRMSSYLEMNSKNFHIEIFDKKNRKNIVYAINLSGEIVNSNKIEKVKSVLNKDFKSTHHTYNPELNIGFNIKTTKVKPVEKKAQKKQSILYSYNVKTKEINEQQISNDIFVYAKPLRIITLDDSTFIFYKTNKRKADDKLFLEKYDRNLKKTASIEVTNLVPYNFRDRSYLSSDDGRIILKSKNKCIVLNSDLEILLNYENENKIHLAKLNQNKLFLLIKGEGGSLFELE